MRIITCTSLSSATSTPREITGNMLCLGCAGLWSADCCMPQRVRMFPDGLARQVGDDSARSPIVHVLLRAVVWFGSVLARCEEKSSGLGLASGRLW